MLYSYHFAFSNYYVTSSKSTRIINYKLHFPFIQTERPSRKHPATVTGYQQNFSLVVECTFYFPQMKIKTYERKKNMTVIKFLILINWRRHVSQKYSLFSVSNQVKLHMLLHLPFCLSKNVLNNDKISCICFQKVLVFNTIKNRYIFLISFSRCARKKFWNILKAIWFFASLTCFFSCNFYNKLLLLYIKYI